MFRPMAITVCSALAGSLLLALTMVPMLASFSFHADRSGRGRSGTAAGWRRQPTAIAACSRGRSITAPVTIGAPPWYWPSRSARCFHRHRFMPRLDEGSS